MWIDLYRNEHENVKIFESYVSHRNRLKRCCTAKYRQNDSAQCSCASAIGLRLVQWGLNGVSRD